MYRLTKYVAAFAAISVIGCGGGASKTPAMQTASAAVTPAAGGTVKLADNSVKLEVPPGAVDGDKTITMTTTDATAPQGITADSPILQFEPSGTVFKMPVTVTFTFKSAKDPVVFWSNDKGGYDMIDGTVTGTSIAAPVTHFSTGFVGDRPTGGSATCGQGVQCTAGMTCGYGSAPLSGSGGGTSGGSNGGSLGAAADASAPATDPGSGMTRAALSSSDPPSGAAICCSCGADGTFQCSTCSGSTVTSTCAEGAMCRAGSSCQMGTTAGGGGTNTGSTGGGTMSGAAADASAPSTDPGAAPIRAALSSGDPTCCTCGADGLYHCGGTCMPPSGGADASAGGMTGGGGGALDGGSMGGDPSAYCTQGAACQVGAPPCGMASTGGACVMCTCGADGTRSCASCDHNTGTGGQGGMVTATCTQGATCAGAAPDCKNAAQGGACQMCHCGADGTYACTPCSGLPPADDGGAPVQGHDAGTGGTMTTGCNPGSPCNPADKCDNGVQGAGCYACQCGGSGTYQCAPCGGGGAADGGSAGTGGTGGSTTLPPDACMQGLKCPQPGASCMGLTVNGVCPKCVCGANGTLACQQAACQ